MPEHRVISVPVTFEIDVYFDSNERNDPRVMGTQRVLLLMDALRWDVRQEGSTVIVSPIEKEAENDA